MKVKIEVKSWNNYSPPSHTHISGGGRGLIRLTLHQGQLFIDAKLFNGTGRYQKFLLSPKKAYLDYIKLHGVHGNPSGTVVGSFASRPKISTCVLHILSKIFSLFH